MTWLRPMPKISSLRAQQGESYLKNTLGFLKKEIMKDGSRASNERVINKLLGFQPKGTSLGEEED